MRAECRIHLSENLAGIVRVILLSLTAAPVLALTILLAAVGFLGSSPGALAEQSVFRQMGWVANAVVPAALISLTMVGCALRERSPTYAFGAGLVANATLMGGYALSVVLNGGPLDAVEMVRIAQMGALLAAIWAGVWLLVRAWVFGRRAESESPVARPLLTIQMALAGIGNALVVSVGFWLCLLAQGADAPRSSVMGAIGSPLGWTALIMMGLAWALGHYQHRSLPIRDAGVFGLAAIVLLACQVEAHWPGFGYQTLMLGWAAYPLAWVLSVFVAPSPPRRFAPSLFLDAADYWVRLAGLLGTALALNSAISHGEYLWAGLAIGMISSAAAVMAVWRRRETWAFAAGLGANLAASLVVWHFNQNLALSDWWIVLLQVNVVAASAISLLWLAWRQQMKPVGWAESSRPTTINAAESMKVGLEDSAHPTATTGIRFSSLLTWQIALGLLGLAVLLVVPVLALVLSPANPPLPSEFGGVGSWLALVIAMTAAGWFFSEFAPSRIIHLVGCFGLGVGILSACFVCQEWDYNGTWLSYHVLTASWWVGGVVMLIIGWKWSTGEDVGSRIEDGRSSKWLSSILHSPSSVFFGWLHTISLLVLALGLGSALGDPGRLYWSSGPVLAVSLLLGAMALWQRRPMHVYASGILVNVAGSLIWLASESHSWEHLVYVNVLSFAVAGGLWAGLELWLKRPRQADVGLGGTPGVFDGRGLATEVPSRPSKIAGVPPVGFPHFAIILGLILCTAMSVLAVGSAGLDLPALEIGVLAWTAWAAMTVATLVLLWDATADFARLGLYVLGLSAILLALQGTQQTAVELGWSLAVTAAPYVLVIALLAIMLPNWEKLRASLRLPTLPTFRHGRTRCGNQLSSLSTG